MKKMIKVFTAAMMMASLAGCQTNKESEMIVGGWTTVDDGTVTEDLQEIFDKATESLIGVNYKVIELLEKQIVSGTNYKFLCEATAVSPNAKPKQVIVTIYEDLNGNVKVTDIEDVETTGIANPFITADTIKEAEEGAGFVFTVPENIEEYTITSITYIEKDMIQVIYGDENTICIRKANGNKDISGDYNEYQTEEDRSIDEKNVNVKGNEEGIYHLTWTDEEYSYAIICSEAITDALAEELVQSVK